MRLMLYFDVKVLICFLNFFIGNMDRASNICRFYLNGNCHYDSFCRYSHNTLQNETTLRNWIDAPEFVPRNSKECKQIIYEMSQETESTAENMSNNAMVGPANQQPSYARILIRDASHPKSTELCPYTGIMQESIDGSIHCRYGERCTYSHGLICDICGKYCLHPNDEEKRKIHQKVLSNKQILFANMIHIQ